MVLQVASCDKQYEKFPQLIRSEVLQLQDWYNRQSHTPNITGKKKNENKRMVSFSACYSVVSVSCLILLCVAYLVFYIEFIKSPLFIRFMLFKIVV